MRQLHNEILDVHRMTKKSRVSFAVMPPDFPETSLRDGDDHSDIDEEGEAVGGGGGSPPGDKLFATHRINDDLHIVQGEIETMEANIEQLMQHDENHLLVKARYENEISELKEQIDKLASEKSQLVVQINSSPSKKVKNQESKVGEKRRLRIKELEKSMAKFQK